MQERPDLAKADFAGAWPAFMWHDAVSAALFERLIAVHPEHTVALLDGARLVARGSTFPFTADPDAPPDGGYDAIILGAAADLAAGRPGTLAGAVEIAVDPGRRGAGLSRLVLDAMRANVRRLGFSDLMAPVRPTLKHREPYVPFEQYVGRRRADGLPEDPWLRTHVRAGGEVGAVAPRSMTIVGSRAEWQRWTGVPFDADGPVVVPDALVPVHYDAGRDQAVYVEPNVWVRHRLATAPVPRPRVSADSRVAQP